MSSSSSTPVIGSVPGSIGGLVPGSIERPVPGSIVGSGESSSGNKSGDGSTNSTNSSPTSTPQKQKSFRPVDTSSMSTAMIAGGCAGTMVDVTLFPLDTIKTRIQTKEGFRAAGGFSGIYRGVSAAALGSAPSASLFFITYEGFKPIISDKLKESNSNGHHPKEWLSHSISASLGELASCLVRVPTEGVKQKMQVAKAVSASTCGAEGGAASSVVGTEAATSVATSVNNKAAARASVAARAASFGSFNSTVKTIYKEQGILGFYIGFCSTIAREVPFAFIQFPIYEALKEKISNYQNYEATPLQGAGCGSVGGAIAGGLTTPLDVVKTRLMTRDVYGKPSSVSACASVSVDKSSGSSSLAVPSLGKSSVGNSIPKQHGMVSLLIQIGRTEGVKGFFRGLTPRVTWISIGGFVFFGTYEMVKKMVIGIQ